MPAFTNDTEIYKYIGGIFRAALDNPDMAARLQGSGITLKVVYTDPDAALTIDFPHSEICEGTSSLRPDVEMFMTADTANLFWLGKLNLSVAMAKGQVRTKGPVSKILKLVPIAKDLFPSYRSMLEQDGRTDLLNA